MKQRPKAHPLMKAGIATMALSLPLWIADRSTGLLTDSMGTICCGEDYLRPIDGIVSESSCGFDTDIYLSLALLSSFSLGALFTLAGYQRARSLQRIERKRSIP